MRRSVGIMVLLIVGMLLTTSFAVVRPMNISNSSDKMQVDKKVWDGNEWVDEINANIGDTVRFNISIYQPVNDTDNESFLLYNIIIKDTLPPGLSYVDGSAEFKGNYSTDGTPDLEIPQINGNTLIWDLGFDHLAIPEGGVLYIEYSANVTSSGSLRNVVNVSAYHCSGITVYGEARADVDVVVPQPEIGIEKTVGVSGGNFGEQVDVSRGDNVTFRIVVSNKNDTDFDMVTVVDHLPSGITYIENTSVVNGNKSEPGISGNDLTWIFDNISLDDFPMVILFNATVDGCGVLENVANVTATYGCDSFYAEDTASVNVTCNPGVRVIKKVSLDGQNWSKSVEAYLPKIDKVYFMINITNTGDVDLTGTLEDFLPPFLVYNGDSNIPPTFSNNSYLNWSDGLPRGASVEIIFSTTPISGGIGENVVKVTSDQGVNDSDSVTIKIYKPSIDVSKMVKRFCPETDWNESVRASPGQIVEFRVDITYHGNPLDPMNYVFHNITIVDKLPSVLQYLTNTSSFSGDWSNWDEYYTSPIEPTLDPVNNTLTWNLDDIFRIPDNGTLTLYFRAQVIDNADCGVFNNTAIVTGNECSGMHLEGTDNASVDIPCPNVEIEKRIRDPGSGEWKDNVYIFYGDEMTFNITVDNIGDRDVSGIEVRDPLISNLQFISGTPQPVINGNELVWSNINVNGGEKFYIEFTAKFTGVNCYGCYNNTAYLTYYVGCKQIVKNDSAKFCIRNDGYPPRSHVNDISPYWHNSNFTITATAHDNETYVARVDLYYSYSDNGSNWTAWQKYGSDTNGDDGWSWDFSGSDGYYRFCSIAYDSVGNREDKVYAEEAAAGIDTVPPISNVNPVSPYRWNETPITLTYNASDDRSGIGEVILYYRYSSDNSSWTNWTEGDWTFDAPNNNGYYEFYSVAIDNAGNRESSPSQADAMCLVELPAPLRAIIVSPPTSGLVGQDLTFNGGVSGGYAPYSFHWEFGDGSVADGTSVTHRYTSSGTFTVTLTVTDRKSHTDSATTEVIIHPLEELKVNITKPALGGVYFGDRKILSLPINMTIVIGKITISADVENAYGDVAVEFKIDNVSKSVVDSEPFNYTWNERAFFKHHIEVIAYDNFDGVPTRTSNATRDIFIFNFGFNRTTSVNKTGTIRGKVYDASKPIRKTGIPGVKVTVVGTTKNVTTGRFLWMKGRFSLRLSPGEYTLKFEKEGYETKEIDVNVTAGNVTRINVPLNRTKPGYIKGKVYVNGTLLRRGIGGVKVTVVETNTTVTTTRFVLKGRYSIKLNPGTYHIKFEKDGYATKIVEVTLNSSEIKRINVGLDIVKTGVLYGRVLKSGKLLFRGIKGAEIDAVNNETGDHFNTTSGIFGKYSMELPVGNYTIHVSAEGYNCSEPYYVTIEPNKKIRHNFKLEEESD